MSKGYTVCPLMRQPRENVIDEKMIRECIFLSPAAPADSERIQFVGNYEKKLLDEKVQQEVRSCALHKVSTLLFSFRQLGAISNLVGLDSLTKLHLDNNHITKIENLDHLPNLRWLDLSFNNIATIENLDFLTQLENLSLFANKITSADGLGALTQLSNLSLGKNPLENLDDVARSLHHLPQLRVLVLRGSPIETLPQYRARLLAFVPNLKFLDGRFVKASDVRKAREEQHENLLPVYDEDERIENQKRSEAEQAATVAEYKQLNCPNESQLLHDLLQALPDGYNVQAILQSDVFIAATKEILDRFHTELSEEVKELEGAMRAVRERRDADERAFTNATAIYKAGNATKAKALIKGFEKKLKKTTADALDHGDGAEVSASALSTSARSDLDALKAKLLELEADQYDTLDSLNNGTITKWQADGVEVLLQTAFEGFLRLESNFQVALLQQIDALYVQRHKRDHNPDEYYLTTKGDEKNLAFLENKEEYQKVLGEWSEMRRKHLEDLEVRHLKSEESLLAERSDAILRAALTCHRVRLNEISSYIEQKAEEIKALTG